MDKPDPVLLLLGKIRAQLDDVMKMVEAENEKVVEEKQNDG